MQLREENISSYGRQNGVSKLCKSVNASTMRARVNSYANILKSSDEPLADLLLKNDKLVLPHQFEQNEDYARSK